jgi:hypothetical protein
MTNIRHLAVFYHCRISGGTAKINGGQTPIKPEFGQALFKEQIQAMVESGLYANAHEVFIGLNGEGRDAAFVDHNMPEGCKMLVHGERSESLLPTFHFIQDWLPGHDDWFVCFFHTKGVTHPGDAFVTNWRKIMERHVIWNWRRCVGDLESGMDTVGAGWITPENHPAWAVGDTWMPKERRNKDGSLPPFWGGVFWWATAKYLIGLPKIEVLEPKERSDWSEPEWWLGRGKPKVKDYQPGIC